MNKSSRGLERYVGPSTVLELSGSHDVVPLIHKEWMPLIHREIQGRKDFS